MNVQTAPTPKSKRDLHPRAQLAYHQRCAARAQSKIDWLHELADRHSTPDPDCPLDFSIDPDEIAALQAKVLSHIKACVVLNDEHDLGFRVTAPMRQTVGL